MHTLPVTSEAEAVEKYMTAETERQEEFREARGQWLSSLFESSFFGGMSSRFQVTSSLEKQVRLQEEPRGIS